MKLLSENLFINLFLLLLPACQEANKPESKMEKTRQEKIEHNKALVKKWILEGWNQNRNKEVVADVFAANWIDGNPTFAEQPKGIDGAMYYVDVYRKIFPDIQFELTHILAEEDIVCFRCKITATHEGEFMGIAPTHKKVNFTGIVIHRIADGKFAESWNEIDLLGIRQQLASD
jgi:predicted ester cyclase